MTVKGLPPINILSGQIRQAIHYDQGYLQKAKLADYIGEGYARTPQLNWILNQYEIQAPVFYKR